MGTKITELFDGKEVSLLELKGKTFTVDSFNVLYQFLSSIRQRDGSYLTDSKGRVTSHLIGLFNRITRLMMNDMKFVFCFDGKVPELKHGELAKRKEAKQKAEEKYEAAKEEGDVKAMVKFAQRTTKLTPDMVEEAKKLIIALGQCCIQAPSEGEAQASYIVKKGDAHAVISQDADCFLFGSPKLMKNLTISGKRKIPGTQSYKEVLPELISLNKNLSALELDQEQLIVLGILVGTDFNPGGVKGIGPKKALKLVKENDDYGEMFESLEYNFDWKAVYDVIVNMEVTDDYKIEFSKPDNEAILALLVDEHDFDRERVEKTLKELGKSNTQKGLGDFF